MRSTLWELFYLFFAFSLVSAPSPMIYNFFVIVGFASWHIYLMERTQGNHHCGGLPNTENSLVLERN